MKKGDKVIIHTAVNFLWIGRVARITKSEVTLEDASWVADTARFGEFVKAGKVVESEHVGTIVIARGAIVHRATFDNGIDLPTVSR